MESLGNTPGASSPGSGVPGDLVGSSWAFRVTDLKQWFYCRRILYWTYVVPIEKRLPPKVTFGAADHALLAHLEQRRTLRSYGLKEGQRRFHVRVASERLGLVGVLDALLQTPGERIPVEYKDTLGGVRLNHRIQLAAYALLLREVPGPPVKRGMVFAIPEGKAYSVRLDAALLGTVEESLTAMRRVLAEEELPEPPVQRAKCRNCEFLRFCGDRYA